MLCNQRLRRACGGLLCAQKNSRQISGGAIHCEHGYTRSQHLGAVENGLGLLRSLTKRYWTALALARVIEQGSQAMCAESGGIRDCRASKCFGAQFHGIPLESHQVAFVQQHHIGPTPPASVGIDAFG
jgi:hypothetical protein